MNKLKRLSVSIAFFCFLSLNVLAQNNKSGEEKLSVNQTDTKGHKHGLWYTSKTARMGEPGFTEFGSYNHGNKYGSWYKIDNTGELMAIEDYRNNVLDGEVKYFDRGQLYCIGRYRGLNPKQKFDTIMVVHPETQLESYRIIPTEAGTMRHGMWRYYDPQTGHLIKEEEYQVDELIYKKEFEISAKADSIYSKQHQQKMPHNNKEKYTPPSGKPRSYTEY